MRPLHIFYALLVPILWGGNFTAVKIGLEHFPPLLLTALRFALTALVLLPFVKMPTREQAISMGKLSLLNSLHFSLPYVAMAMGLSIATTGLTVQLGVPFSCIVGAVLFNDKLGRWRTLGMTVAFAGMFILFGSPEIDGKELAWLCAVIAALFWSIANIVTRTVKTDGMLQLLAWTSLYSVPQLLLASLLFESLSMELFYNIPTNVMLALAYTVSMSSIVAYGLWNYLLRTHKVSQVSPFALLTPVVGTLIGMWALGETISTHVLIGGAVVIAGVAIIVVRKPKLGMLDEPV